MAALRWILDVDHLIYHFNFHMSPQCSTSELNAFSSCIFFHLDIWCFLTSFSFLMLSNNSLCENVNKQACERAVRPQLVNMPML